MMWCGKFVNRVVPTLTWLAYVSELKFIRPKKRIISYPCKMIKSQYHQLSKETRIIALITVIKNIPNKSFITNTVPDNKAWPEYSFFTTKYSFAHINVLFFSFRKLLLNILFYYSLKMNKREKLLVAQLC